jgi:hypothetical protein
MPCFTKGPGQQPTGRGLGRKCSYRLLLTCLCVSRLLFRKHRSVSVSTRWPGRTFALEPYVRITPCSNVYVKVVVVSKRRWRIVLRLCSSALRRHGPCPHGEGPEMVMFTTHESSVHEWMVNMVVVTYIMLQVALQH